MMENWQKCFKENKKLQSCLASNSNYKFDGFNPIRDRFSSEVKDRSYLERRTRSHAGKGRVQMFKGKITLKKNVKIIYRPQLQYYQFTKI